jgi:hypothetical protein
VGKPLLLIITVQKASSLHATARSLAPASINSEQRPTGRRGEENNVVDRRSPFENRMFVPVSRASRASLANDLIKY